MLRVATTILYCFRSARGGITHLSPAILHKISHVLVTTHTVVHNYNNHIFTSPSIVLYRSNLGNNFLSKNNAIPTYSLPTL